MNVNHMEIQSFNDVFKNVAVVRLLSGELLIGMLKNHPTSSGCFLLLPTEIKNHEDEMFLDQWMPFFKDRVFFFKFSDIQFIKSDPMDHLRDSYIDYINLVNKDDIVDLISSIQEHLEEIKLSEVHTHSETVTTLH